MSHGTHIQIHRSGTTGAVPDASAMLEGELAVNMRDKLMWIKGPGTTLIPLISGASAETVAGTNSQIQFNANDGFSADSKLLYDSITKILTSAGGFSGGGATFASTVNVQGNLNIAEDGYIGVGSGDERIIFDGDNGDISLETNIVFIKGALAHTGDVDTKLVFGTDEITLRAGGKDFLDANANGVVHVPFGISGAGATFANNVKFQDGVSFDSDITVSGNILLADDGFIGLGSGQDRIIIDSNGNDITLNTNDILMNSKLMHLGDTDTFMEFTIDAINFHAGDLKFLSLTESAIGQDEIVVNNDGVDIDFRVEGDTDNSLLYTRADIDEVAVGTTPQGTGWGHGKFHVEGLATSSVGFSADGATFGFRGVTVDGSVYVAEDIKLDGNLIVPEDGEIYIGGDSEKIIFNGSGSGSSSIDIKATLVDFGQGSGCQLRSHGDATTYFEFVNDADGAGDDGINIVCDNTTYMHIGSGTSGVSFADNEIIRPKIKDFSETFYDNGSVNGVTLDFENGNVQMARGIGSGATSSMYGINLTNPPPSGSVGTMTLILTNGVGMGQSGGHMFAPEIKWPSGAAPTLTNQGHDIMTFMTTDAGGTYYGFVGGLNFS